MDMYRRPFFCRPCKRNRFPGDCEHAPSVEGDTSKPPTNEAVLREVSAPPSGNRERRVASFPSEVFASHEVFNVAPGACAIGQIAVPAGWRRARVVITPGFHILALAWRRINPLTKVLGQALLLEDGIKRGQVLRLRAGGHIRLRMDLQNTTPETRTLTVEIFDTAGKRPRQILDYEDPDDRADREEERKEELEEVEIEIADDDDLDDEDEEDEDDVADREEERRGQVEEADEDDDEDDDPDGLYETTAVPGAVKSLFRPSRDIVPLWMLATEDRQPCADCGHRHEGNACEACGCGGFIYAARDPMMLTGGALLVRNAVAKEVLKNPLLAQAIDRVPAEAWTAIESTVCKFMSATSEIKDRQAESLIKVTNRFPLPFPEGTIPPYATATIVTRPQISCRIRRLVVAPDDDLRIVDLRVGKLSSWLSYGEISALAFPAFPPDLSAAAIEAIERAGFFENVPQEVVQVGMDLSITVRNVGHEPRRLRAMMLTDAVAETS